MKKRFGIGKKSMLDEEIERVTKIIGEVNPAGEDYAIAVENLERLYKVESERRRNGVSPDTIAIVAANLIGIGLILTYEELNVISTKALGFVMKGRV